MLNKSNYDDVRLPAYHATFLSRSKADNLYRQLEGQLADRWQQESFSVFGKQVYAPRSVAWFGDADVNYRYTGLDHRTVGWPTWLQPLQAEVELFSGCCFNYVLINYYANGAQYMGWHADDESAVDPYIASVSLGAARRFRYRVSSTQPSQALELAPGSLLLMDGRLKHCLPKTKRVQQPRINLTFRHIAAK